MSTLKTQENNNSVIGFVNQVSDVTKRNDALALLELFEHITECKAKMWGTSIIGYGRYHYQNSGKGGTWPLTGFSPRKTALTLYIMSGFSEYEHLLGKLGKHKTGKSCLYIKKLSDIDLDVLTELIKASLKYMASTYTCEFD